MAKEKTEEKTEKKAKSHAFASRYSGLQVYNPKTKMQMQFRNSHYVTSDPKEIEILSKAAGVVDVTKERQAHQKNILEQAAAIKKAQEAEEKE